MSKPKLFIVPLHVYPFDVMVSIGQSDEVLKEALKRYDVDDSEELWKYAGDYCQARYVTFSNNASLIRLREARREPEALGVLQHEIFHVVSAIMDRVGIKLELMVSDEAYAYLVQYLTTEIYRNI